VVVNQGDGQYLHGNDAGKRKVQLKRIVKRGTRV
jgi:hypothetical protein